MPRSAPNFSEYRTVGEAAEFLGVSPGTLRNWDRSGKLRSRRHPQNGYRIYLNADLEAVLRAVHMRDSASQPSVPRGNFSQIGETGHFVQFYEHDDFLIDSLLLLVGDALTEQAACVVIATPEHCAALQDRLATSGLDETAARSAERYLVLDAAATLDQIMVDGMPDRDRFHEVIGEAVSALAERSHRVVAFGEMVALLWADGHRPAAIALEGLWNELAKKHRFALLCAYPLAAFSKEGDGEGFDGVCACHTHVIPTERYASLADSGGRLREIAMLQQKARVLEAEIAHRKEVERSLAGRERELADFFENAIEGLHKVGPDGTILWANKAECKLLGYSPQEYIGRSICDFHVDPEVIADMLDKLGRGETLENYPARLRSKSGGIKHVLVNSNAHFEDEKLVYTRCFTRDITDRWRAEKALRDADRRKNEFLATLAHELRNPLAPISNALEILKLAEGSTQSVQASRGIMERQLRHMVRLVDDLLDFSRIARGKIELRKQRVELASVVATAVETSQPLMAAAGHRLQVVLPPEPIFVDADPTRLAQVFGNLLNNAAKYTNPGGSIELTAQPRGDDVVVSVRDNGIGIPCDKLAHVFEMFRQIEGASAQAQGGLGIGLTLVRSLVELHGGTVNALSEGPGKGSEFVVHLPLARGRAPAAARPREAPTADVPRKRILIAEDNHDSAETLATLLRVKGHEVRTVHDGLQAVEMAEVFSPEFVLMDLGMPHLDGLQATRRIRESSWGRKMFIVALSGWGQPIDVQRSIEAGCSGHLVKPVEFAALEELLSVDKPVSG